MSKPPIKIEPIGARRRQGCVRWVMLIVLIAVVLTMVMATAKVSYR